MIEDDGFRKKSYKEICRELEDYKSALTELLDHILPLDGSTDDWGVDRKLEFAKLQINLDRRKAVERDTVKTHVSEIILVMEDILADR